MTTKIENYVFLRGRCEEAIEFYKQAIGATVAFCMRYSDSPDPIPPGQLPEGFEDKIMHATLKVDEATLMLSDGCDTETPLSGFRVSLSLPTKEEVESAFEKLSAGGSVDMPLTPTFWSPYFGMLTDQFGVAWMVTVTSQDDA